MHDRNTHGVSRRIEKRILHNEVDHFAMNTKSTTFEPLCECDGSANIIVESAFHTPFRKSLLKLNSYCHFLVSRQPSTYYDEPIDRLLLLLRLSSLVVMRSSFIYSSATHLACHERVGNGRYSNNKNNNDYNKRNIYQQPRPPQPQKGQPYPLLDSSLGT